MGQIVDVAVEPGQQRGGVFAQMATSPLLEQHAPRGRGIDPGTDAAEQVPGRQGNSGSADVQSA